VSTVTRVTHPETPAPRGVEPPASTTAAPATTAKRGRQSIPPERPTVNDAAVPELGEKHVAGEGRPDTCFHARTGDLLLTALAWPPMSDSGRPQVDNELSRVAPSVTERQRG
jgi:hypothetical protein